MILFKLNSDLDNLARNGAVRIDTEKKWLRFAQSKLDFSYKFPPNSPKVDHILNFWNFYSKFKFWHKNYCPFFGCENLKTFSSYVLSSISLKPAPMSTPDLEPKQSLLIHRQQIFPWYFSTTNQNICLEIMIIYTTINHKTVQNCTPQLISHSIKVLTNGIVETASQ